MAQQQQEISLKKIFPIGITVLIIILSFNYNIINRILEPDDSDSTCRSCGGFVPFYEWG